MMNAEVIKAINKKENTKKETIRKWWNKNRYKVMRIIFFPIWLGICAKNKIETWLNSRHTWNEERAKEIFDYYIPRTAEWNEEDKTFCFFDNGYGWSFHSAKKYLKMKDRRFWKVNCGWWACGGKLRKYLIDTFELEGFTKEVEDCYESRTEIYFKMIEK